MAVPLVKNEPRGTSIAMAVSERGDDNQPRYSTDDFRIRDGRDAHVLHHRRHTDRSVAQGKVSRQQQMSTIHGQTQTTTTDQAEF